MTCPICKKPTTQSYRPFCSKHCADVDLGRWMKGSYAIPGEDIASTDGSSDTGTDTEYNRRED